MRRLLAALGAVLVCAWLATGPLAPPFLRRGQETSASASSSGSTTDTEPLGVGVPASMPAVVLVEVSRNGRIVSAKTNTGQPPDPGDEAYVVRTTGKLDRVDPEEFEGITWKADPDEPGRYVPDRDKPDPYTGATPAP